MEDILGFMGAFYLIPSLIIGMIGFILGWLLKPGKKVVGDLSIEGEGALRAEADSLRARVQDLESRVASKDKEVSDLKTKLASDSASPAGSTEKTSDADDTYALEWQNRYLAARVKYLDSRLAELGDPDTAAAAKPASAKKPATKKATAKKAPAKKAATTPKTAAKPKKATAKAASAKKAPAKTTVAKKAVAKKAPAKKATTKAVSTTAAKKVVAKKAAVKKAPEKKAAAKKTTGAKVTSKKDAAFERYYEKVKAYDARASRTVVQNIVNYCGVSLKSRDSSLVACSDETELRTVANGFVTKKLGLETGQMDLVKSICAQMKDQRLKSRVTFYYLAAKKAKKLSLFK